MVKQVGQTAIGCKICQLSVFKRETTIRYPQDRTGRAIVLMPGPYDSRGKKKSTKSERTIILVATGQIPALKRRPIRLHNKLNGQASDSHGGAFQELQLESMTSQ